MGTGFFYTTAVKRVVFVSDMMSHIIHRGRWCNMIVLNVHEPNKEKSDDSKDSFCEELEKVFLSFPSVPYDNFIRRF